MPGYVPQESNAIPYRHYDPTIKSKKAESRNLPTEPTSQTSPDRSGQSDDISTAYPAYPPPPYSRETADPNQGEPAQTQLGPFRQDEGIGRRRSSKSSRRADSATFKRKSSRRYKPGLSIDTGVARLHGAKPREIRRAGKLESSSHRVATRSGSSAAGGQPFLAPGPSSVQAPSSVYPRDTDDTNDSRHGAFTLTYRSDRQPLDIRDSVADNREEDGAGLAQKTRVTSTGTIFEEDEAPYPRQPAPEETPITPTPRRSRGWWNVVTTPFQSQRRFTRFAGDVEKIPGVPALPQSYSNQPRVQSAANNLRISPEAVQEYLASGSRHEQHVTRARQESNASTVTSIDVEESDEHESQHNRHDALSHHRDSGRTAERSQNIASRFSEFSPEDREVPVMLSFDIADVPTTNVQRGSHQDRDVISVRPSRDVPRSAWSPLTSIPDDSPESQRSHFHSPVVHAVAIDSLLNAGDTPQRDHGSVPVRNAAWRVTQHSPDPAAFQRYSHAAQFDDDSRDPSYRPNTDRSPSSNTKSTPGASRQKPKSSFTFSEAPGEKKNKRLKKKKKRRCCCCWLCILLLILLLLATAVVVPVVVTREHHRSSTGSIWVNISGYPPMPTGTLTIAQPNLAYNVSGCVNPSAMWSCAVPKEQQAAIAPNQPDQPDFLLDIFYVSPNTSSSLSSAFQPSPGPPALDEQDFLGNTTDNNTQPFAGETTPFYITFNPSFAAGSTSEKLKLKAKRQGGSDGINTSESQLGSSPTSSGSASTSAINSIPDLATAIPLPSTNPDGTALPADLLPFPAYQPVRLYNRGLATEHYGFYTYFDRSIFMKSISIQNSTEQAEGDIPADADGGSAFEGATARCTWSNTRFVVQIWTRSNAALLPKASASAAPTPTTSALGAAETFVRPGSFPYPITITLDRHGGGLMTKMLYCYGLDERGDVEVNDKLFQREDRSFGGTVVNPALGPFTSVNVSTAQGGPGGIDGGTGGCLCRWQNF